MTIPGPNSSQTERLHPATSSSLSPPPSSPAPLPNSQSKPPTPLPLRTTRSKSVPPILPSSTAKSATTTNKPKPTCSEISSLYQYIWDRIDDLKIITGALCERLIALEDTVAALDEDDNMEIFMRKAFDMATEGQLIAMIAEQFKEMGSKIADRGTDVGFQGGDCGKGEGDGDGVDIENGHEDGNDNGNGDGEENMNGNGNGTQENQGREKRRASVSDPDTDSDPDL